MEYARYGNKNMQTEIQKRKYWSEKKSHLSLSTDWQLYPVAKINMRASTGILDPSDLHCSALKIHAYNVFSWWGSLPTSVYLNIHWHHACGNIRPLPFLFHILWNSQNLDKGKIRKRRHNISLLGNSLSDTSWPNPPSFCNACTYWTTNLLACTVATGMAGVVDINTYISMEDNILSVCSRTWRIRAVYNH